MKKMRSIAVNENAVRVIFIEGIAGDMFPLVDYQHVAACRGELLSHHAAREPCANHQNVKLQRSLLSFELRVELRFHGYGAEQLL